MSVLIYHNPDCSKSCTALNLLSGGRKDAVIRNYLIQPLSKSELRDLLQKLAMRAEDIVRKKEPLFIAKFADREYTDEEWLDILTENPILIERPIVVNGNKAVVARPPDLEEKLSGLFD